MTDSKKEREKNLRLAYEETNRWFRHTENFVWALSSLLITFTVFTIKYVIKSKNGDPDGDLLILFLVILVFIWISYLAFLRHTLSRIYSFHDKANSIEKKLGLDVLPELDEKTIKKNYDKAGKKAVPLIARIILFVRPVNFATLMVYLAVIVICMCIGLGLWIYGMINI